MACLCQESRISATNGKGGSYIARLSIRCATHAAALRATDRAVDTLHRKMTARLPLALPAPRVLIGGF